MGVQDFCAVYRAEDNKFNYIKNNNIYIFANYVIILFIFLNIISKLMVI